MDDNRDDFEEKMEEDEIDALDEQDLLLGIGEDGEPLEVEDEEDLDKFGFHRDDEEELTDF